ncbi:MAG: APC family permease [Polyangiaceae bacterium]|nr:APC family permease [Polyangiaceae bacterium]
MSAPSTCSGRPSSKAFGLYSGLGLVVANMVGMGVLTSSGYMARSLPPRDILAIWVLQGLFAVAGARAYAALAVAVPRSGGEYRYLSDLLHPALGCLAGWCSVLVGFAAPIAANAYAAAAFLGLVVPGLPTKATAAGLLGLLAALQLRGIALARLSQNLLVLAKIGLVVAFVAIGLWLGRAAGPAGGSLDAGGATHGVLSPFVVNLFYAYYAYSGWNAAIYAAEEFDHPKRSIPRAMVLGAAFVMVLYLLVAWVFICNVSEADMGQWDEAKVTMAHLIVRKLVSPAAARAASIGAAVVLLSCMSAMTLMGPRVNAAMAADGYLPRLFAIRGGHAPKASVLLQAALALGLLLTHSFGALMANVGVVLTLVSGLTVCAVFRLRFGRMALPRPDRGAVLAAALFLLGSVWLVCMGVWLVPGALAWTSVLVVVSLVGYLSARQARQRRGDAG